MFRLWSSEGADLSFDVYGDWVLVSDYRVGSDAAPSLPAAYEQHKIIYLYRPRATEHGAAAKVARILLGAAREDDPSYLECQEIEAHIPYVLRMDAPLNPGIFLDSSRLRALVEQMSEGKRVLNLFAYTGGFSLAACRAGAAHIDTVDLSPRYVRWAEENMRHCAAVVAGCVGRANSGEGAGRVIDASGVSTDSVDAISAAGAALDRERYGFFAMDSLEYVRSFGRKRAPYDLIIVDPPTFARARNKRGKNKKGASQGFSVERDAQSLLESLIPLLSPKGQVLFVCNKRGFTLPAGLKKSFARIEQLEDTIPEGYTHQIHQAWLLTSRRQS